MAIFKSLTFDGINSLGYGIYITGEAAYNAPERAVEMVNIPGKNGALALDQGRFENIEVTYPAGCFADSQADFADKVMRFRNVLASRYTYKRLADEYHSDEYRLGLYKSGLDVDAVRYGTAGQFDITFDCKPQRFLLSGEAAVTPSDYGNPQTETGEIVTIDSDGSLGVKSLEVSLSPIQEGSGTPSPTNVRPISGRTEVVTQRTGKNLLSHNVQNGTVSGVTFTINDDKSITAVGTATANIAFTKNNGGVVAPNLKKGYAYALSGGVGMLLAQAFVQLVYIGADTGRIYSLVSTKGEYILNTLSEDLVFDNAYVQIRNGTTINATFKLQLELGTTATDYEPYQGTTYTTSLGRTVYGGTLDVVSGALTVDRAMVDMGSLTWTYSNSFFRTDGITATVKRPPNNQTKVNAICSAYPIMTWTAISGTDTAIAVDTTGRMIVGNPNITSLSDFQTAVSGVQLVYELATPQTYQLTPQQIDLLLGTNHLWSDGEITVEYGVHPYYNPTPFASKPLIKVTGTDTLGIGEYILTITGTASQTLYIDCETMEIYTIEGTVPTGASSLVSINRNDFPVLKPGINNISVGSGITAVTITPRWWRI